MVVSLMRTKIDCNYNIHFARKDYPDITSFLGSSSWRPHDELWTMRTQHFRRNTPGAK